MSLQSMEKIQARSKKLKSIKVVLGQFSPRKGKGVMKKFSIDYRIKKLQIHSSFGANHEVTEKNDYLFEIS